MNKGLQRALVVGVLMVAIALAFLYRDQLDVETLEAWVDHAGTAGPLLFMLLYAVATVLFLPGSVLTLAGGALFGPVWGACASRKHISYLIRPLTTHNDDVGHQPQEIAPPFQAQAAAPITIQEYPFPVIDG